MIARSHCAPRSCGQKQPPAPQTAGAHVKQLQAPRRVLLWHHGVGQAPLVARPVVRSMNSSPGGLGGECAKEHTLKCQGRTKHQTLRPMQHVGTALGRISRPKAGWRGSSGRDAEENTRPQYVRRMAVWHCLRRFENSLLGRHKARYGRGGQRALCSRKGDMLWLSNPRARDRTHQGSLHVCTSATNSRRPSPHSCNQSPTFRCTLLSPHNPCPPDAQNLQAVNEPLTHRAWRRAALCCRP